MNKHIAKKILYVSLFVIIAVWSFVMGMDISIWNDEEFKNL